MIGGCSIGSIIAAQPAMGWNNDMMAEVNKRFFVKGKPTNDYTLPALSIVKGKKLEQYLALGYGDTRIEDLWIPIFVFPVISPRLKLLSTAAELSGRP